MLDPKAPALVLAPMDGITDAPMREVLGATGAFTYAVSEFLRVSGQPIPAHVFVRDVPELANGGLTPTGMPVQVQILGGDPGRMANSAVAACQAGARAIDINFGCPAPTVNRHDGGASLLNHPCRIREIVASVRDAVPKSIPVSAKLRLGWDSIDAIDQNAAMAAEGGAAWLTIHARTRMQGYAPPIYWKPIAGVRKRLGLPVVANGDIWTFDDFLRCREQTGCSHFMIGRSALADPSLPRRIARELGIPCGPPIETDWPELFRCLADRIGDQKHALARLKQWTKIAHLYGGFALFHDLKQAQTLSQFFERLEAWAAAS